MTDISRDAVEGFCRILEGDGNRFKSVKIMRALLARVEELSRDREQLALAIMNGEDAPGYAAAQTTETLCKLADTNRVEARQWAEYDAAKAEALGYLRGLEAASVKLSDLASQCGLYGQSQAVADGYLRSSRAIQSLITEAQGDE